jgi:hypothetical protein
MCTSAYGLITFSRRLYIEGMIVDERERERDTLDLYFSSVNAVCLSASLSVARLLYSVARPALISRQLRQTLSVTGFVRNEKRIGHWLYVHTHTYIHTYIHTDR